MATYTEYESAVADMVRAQKENNIVNMCEYSGGVLRKDEWNKELYVLRIRNGVKDDGVITYDFTVYHCYDVVAKQEGKPCWEIVGEGKCGLGEHELKEMTPENIQAYLSKQIFASKNIKYLSVLNAEEKAEFVEERDREEEYDDYDEEYDDYEEDDEEEEDGHRKVTISGEIRIE